MNSTELSTQMDNPTHFGFSHVKGLRIMWVELCSKMKGIAERKIPRHHEGRESIESD